MLNVIGTINSALLLFFQRVKPKFVIYNVFSLFQPGKPLIILQNDTNVLIFQAHRGRNKERPGFPHPYFVLDFHIFMPCCSHTSALIFAGTYFGLTFRNIRKLVFANNTRFFIRGAFIRKSLGIIKIKKLLTNMTMLRFAPQLKNLSIGKQFIFRAVNLSCLLFAYNGPFLKVLYTSLLLMHISVQ